MKKIQIEAGRFVTGATKSCSSAKILQKTGWETLETRSRKHRLTTFYKMINKNTITYLVNSRPYIEICRVCKIYGRRCGTSPSIYFTNPTYFYVRSGTDQISVLFRWGPLFVYAVLRKIRKFIRTADKLLTSMLARNMMRDVTLWRHWRRYESQGLLWGFLGAKIIGKINITWL